MAGRNLPSLLALFLVSAVPAVAVAEDGAEQQPAEPKVLAGGADDNGNHAFLFGRSGGPSSVFVGQAGNMRELEVLGIERFPGQFVVDTLELGTIKFQTGRLGKSGGVIFPGDIGFHLPDDPNFQPTINLNRMPDPNVYLEVVNMMRPGGAQPAAAPKQIEARALPRGTQDGRVRSMRKSNARFKKKGRVNRRPAARTRLAKKQNRVRTH